jgi:hypothetical protein
MPPKDAKLPDAEISDLTAWVKMGAPDPDRARRHHDRADGGKKHWAGSHSLSPAFRKCMIPLAEVADRQLRSSEARGETPQTQSRRDKRTLIRRATFDLIGLPPTPEEVEAFVNTRFRGGLRQGGRSALASPQYGERWGRHWLDVARYSDTKGQVKRQREDFHYPFAWSYRDYVIRSFNEDKPYNVFIIEQIAADKLPATARNPSNLTALAFLTIGDRFMGMPNDIINDRIDVVTKGFLGLTVTCARCHDHKFDPIPTMDYYSLHGIFASCVEPPVEPVISKITSGGDYGDYYKKRMDLEREKEALEAKVQGDAPRLNREGLKQLPARAA